MLCVLPGVRNCQLKTILDAFSILKNAERRSTKITKGDPERLLKK